MKAKAPAADTDQALQHGGGDQQAGDLLVKDTPERLKPATRSSRPQTSTRHTSKARPAKKRPSSPAHGDDADAASSLQPPPPSSSLLLLQSASSPGVSDVPTPTPAAAAAAVGRDGTLSTQAATTTTTTTTIVTAAAGDRSAAVDMEGQGSPRARQRLEEAKALDREIAMSEGVDGGG